MTALHPSRHSSAQFSIGMSGHFRSIGLVAGHRLVAKWASIVAGCRIKRFGLVYG